LARRTTTRDRLVRTAAELFWRQGYAQTGVSSIMKQARATSGSFYHFFPTKDDLLVAVFDAVADMMESEVLGPAEAVSADPVERIGVVMSAYVRSVDAGTQGFRLPMGNLVSELGSSQEAARRRIKVLMESVTDRVTDWLTGDDGRFPPQVDRRGLATLIVAALEGAAVVAMASRSRAPVEACVEQLRLHLDLVAGEGGESAVRMRPPKSTADARLDWKAW
jgi:AcrR family transcriptional regulator